MSVQTVTMFYATCDTAACGTQCPDEDGVVAYTDTASLGEVAAASDWLVGFNGPDSYYCPDHWGLHDPCDGEGCADCEHTGIEVVA